MPTEQFTRSDFERQLAHIAAYCNMRVNRNSTSGDEFSYRLSLNDYPDIDILVRSSVSVRTGHADPSGKDSIRLYLMCGDVWLSQVDAWTQRTHGWESRMMEKVTYLAHLWEQAGYCPCGAPTKVRKVSDKNKRTYGRLYAKCDHYKQQGDGHVWKWLE